MASAHFRELYAKAAKAEHVRLQHVRRVAEELGPSDLPGLGRLHDALQEYHAGFEEDLAAIAKRHGMRVKPDRPVCPHCGDPECNGALAAPVVLAQMGAALVRYLLKMLNLG